MDEKADGAVEAVATRKFDGKTLAIEYAIIEPFQKEKEDFTFFEAAFLKIEEDTALPVPGRWIQVFIPVGILRGQPKPPTRNAIVETVHSWIRTNRICLADGFRNTLSRLTFPVRLPSTSHSISRWSHCLGRVISTFAANEV